MSDLRAFKQQIDDACDDLVLAIRSSGRKDLEWAADLVNFIRRQIT